MGKPKTAFMGPLFFAAFLLAATPAAGQVKYPECPELSGEAEQVVGGWFLPKQDGPALACHIATCEATLAQRPKLALFWPVIVGAVSVILGFGLGILAGGLR